MVCYTRDQGIQDIYAASWGASVTHLIDHVDKDLLRHPARIGRKARVNTQIELLPVGFFPLRYGPREIELRQRRK